MGQTLIQDRRLEQWLRGLEARHMADLTFPEVTRALRALSSTYVERRSRLDERSAFDSAGKRAAYALYYGPLHFLTVRLIVDALGASSARMSKLFDVGCGGGAAGAAWASAVVPAPFVSAIDVHPWALREAAWTYAAFGLETEVRRGHASKPTIPLGTDAIVVGWVTNELDEPSRSALKGTLLAAAQQGIQILIVEPISTRVSPWWTDWTNAFAPLGGRADEWRFPAELPDLIKRLDLATGMRHDELTARSLCVNWAKPQPARPVEAGL